MNFNETFLQDCLTLTDEEILSKYGLIIPMELTGSDLLAVVKRQNFEWSFVDPLIIPEVSYVKRVRLVQTGTTKGPFEVYAINDRGGADFTREFDNLDEALSYKFHLILNDLKAFKIASALKAKNKRRGPPPE